MRFTRWDQVSPGDPDGRLTTLALRHCQFAGTHGDALAQLITERKFLAICSFEPEYASLTPQEAWHLRQAQAFFNKRSDIDLGVDREKVAREKFSQSERLCEETNGLFKSVASGQACLPPDVEAVLFRAQRKIARILGPVPCLDSLEPHFGPGATTQVKKRDASSRRKLAQAFACSKDLFPLWKHCVGMMPGWLSPVVEGVHPLAGVVCEIHAGFLRFVPKNARTDRAIVVEPMLNSMFQLAIGKFMAGRLRRFGIDIQDQSRNQRLALLGSLTGALATLDLSSASDTVAIELVWHLLPVDWAHFLSRFRTSEISDKGHAIVLHKFSSMGNGFTFPLETLIFYALAYASTEEAGLSTENVSSYGDDIIAPTGAVPLLTKSLTACGFLLNSEKSFSSGPFRESCGKDYLSGIDVRPFYQKGPLSGTSAFMLHNYYVRRGEPELASTVLEWIEESLQIFGPDGYGDGHLVSDLPLRPHGRERGWSGFIFDTFTWKSRTDFRFRSKSGDRVLPCYSIYAAPTPSMELPPSADWFLAGQTSRFLRRHRGSARFATIRETGAAQRLDSKGNLGVTVPGTDGFKRISIYVH
jgi:hypothetical protein